MALLKLFTSHSLRCTCNPARRPPAMQSHGGRQLVAEMPQCLKKHRVPSRRLAGLSSSFRGAFARYRSELFRDGDAGLGLNISGGHELRKKSAEGLATTQLIGPRLSVVPRSS